MSDVGEEPAKVLEGFICSGTCHVNLASVLLETEVSSRHCPQGTLHLMTWSPGRLPVLLVQAVLH